jgi:DNA-binding response OmpR family regulator
MTDNELRDALLILTIDDTLQGNWSLHGEMTTIGRLDDNDVVVPDRWVSRHHAAIRRSGTRYEIVDLDSKNGLYVNGARVTAPVRLQNGDQIAIAPHAMLTFVDSESTAPVLLRQRGVRIDEDTRQVWVNGQELTPPVSSAQFALLCTLAAHPGRVFSRDDLIGPVWPGEDPAGISDEAVNSLIRRLRRRLMDVDPDHRYIFAVRGHGFRFEQPTKGRTAG